MDDDSTLKDDDISTVGSALGETAGDDADDTDVDADDADPDSDSSDPS